MQLGLPSTFFLLRIIAQYNMSIHFIQSIGKVSKLPTVLTKAKGTNKIKKKVCQKFSQIKLFFFGVMWVPPNKLKLLIFVAKLRGFQFISIGDDSEIDDVFWDGMERNRLNKKTFSFISLTNSNNRSDDAEGNGVLANKRSHAASFN